MQSRRLACRLALCLPALLLGVGTARAASGDAIGSAVTIVNLVTAEINSDHRKLVSGDDVHQQELIEADKDGRGELVLHDDTRLALGPGARLLLDRFVYNPDISGGAIVLQLTRGAFRFITGVAAKPAYVVRVPNASITVRGTVFDVYVQPDGVSWLLLIEGGVEVCTENGKCLVHDEVGKLIRIGPDQVDKPAKWAAIPQKRDISFDSAFPFIIDAPEIDHTHHLTRDEVELGTDKPDKPDKPKDNGDKADNGDDHPRKPKAHSKRQKEVEYRQRRKRYSESKDKGPFIPQGISIGIGGGFGGGHHGGSEGGRGYSPGR
jgi:FecR-like protein